MLERKRPSPQWLFAILDHLMLSRPMILIPVWLFVLLGAFDAQIDWVFPTFLPAYRVIGAFGNFTLLLSGIYLHNQIMDRESDRKNNKLFLISEGIVPLPRAVILCVFLYLAPVGLSLIWGLQHFLVFCCSAVLGVLYNSKPFHFKGRPLLDILSNGVGNGVLNVMVGYTAISTIPDWGYLLKLTVPYALAVGAVFTSTAIPDAEGDRNSGEHGSAVVFGERVSAWLALCLMVAAGVMAFYGENFICLVGAVISVPGFLLAAIKPGRRTHIVAYQTSTLGFALLACLAYLVFLPFLLVVILVTRWYYQKRFALNYPF